MSKILVKTFHGLEQVVLDEVTALGATNAQVARRAVNAEADLRTIYRINYECRTALSVLLEIKRGRVQDEKSLYKLVQQVTWYEHFDLNRTFRIDVICFSDLFNNTLYLTQICKDAVVDQFRDRFGRRPNVSRTPNIRINVYIHRDRCVISLDTSGAALFRRGYRFHTGEAPINEVLAAGMIKLSGWQPDQPFADPMCGSGTLPIEAALMASHTAPQWRREEDFAFQHLSSYDETMWESVKNEADGVTNASIEYDITGLDNDRKVLRAAKQNARRAEIEQVIFDRNDFFKWRPEGPPGVMIFNPPYDERLSLDDAEDFYERIGDHLKQHCQGWHVWIVSGHLEAMKKVGLRPTAKHTLFNGPLECLYLCFEVFAGKWNDRAEQTSS